MAVTSRSYEHARDYERIGRWLERSYRREGEHVNWLQPRWEYMHFHPLIRGLDLSCIGLWEDGDEIVGVVHPEHGLGTAYFEFHPERPAPKAAMLAHAEEHLRDEKGGLRLFIHDRDVELAELAAAAGFSRTERHEVMSRMSLADAPPVPEPPDGFRLQSLADENDLARLHRALWRGFGHGAEPPDDGLEDRLFMQSAPNYRLDLNLVLVSPDGDYVAYGGIWFEATNRVAYVEPVATDPDFRRMGLARIAVLEGIRRCGELGARDAYVGTDLPLYLSLGFEPIYRCSLWES